MGLSPLTTPLQWLGASPARRLQRRLHPRRSPSRRSRCTCSPAALGLQPGPEPRGGPRLRLRPPRAAHLAHLQVLSAYFIPLVFLAAHRYRADGPPGVARAVRGAPGCSRASPTATSSCTCRCCSRPGWRGSFARCPIAAGRSGCSSRGPWPWPASLPSCGATRSGTPPTASSGGSRRSSLQRRRPRALRSGSGPRTLAQPDVPGAGVVPLPGADAVRSPRRASGLAWRRRRPRARGPRGLVFAGVAAAPRPSPPSPPWPGRGACRSEALRSR